MESLLKHSKFAELDRTTVAERVHQILIFEDNCIEITYYFTDDLGLLES